MSSAEVGHSETLKNEIKKIENAILDIRRRLYFLDAYQSEAQRIFGNQPFRRKNDILWMLLIDSYEMLIIHFAGLVKGMYTPGGFFDVLKSTVPALRPKSWRKFKSPKGQIFFDRTMTDDDKKRIEIELSTSFQRNQADMVKKTLLEIFPELLGEAEFRPKPEQIEKLENRFKEEMRSIVNDRDQHRAHRYDMTKPSEIKKEDLVTLDLLSNKFDYLENLMNCLRFIGTDSSFGYSNMCWADTRNTAEDFVDLLQLGNINRVNLTVGDPSSELKYYWQRRENWRKKTTPGYKSRWDNRIKKDSTPSIHLTSICPKENLKLSCDFSDGTEYVVDFELLLDDGQFNFPRDPESFSKVMLLDGIVIWPNDFTLSTDDILSLALEQDVNKRI
jgi:hypothetical protein